MIVDMEMASTLLDVILWSCVAFLAFFATYLVIETWWRLMGNGSSQSLNQNDGNVQFIETEQKVDEFDRLFDERMSNHRIETKREFKDVKGKFVWDKELKKWVLVDRIDLEKKW